MQDTTVANLHGKVDMDRNAARIHRVLIVFGLGTAIAAVLIVLSMIWRDATHMNNPNEMPSQIITIAITVVWGSLLIFFWGMKLSPLLSYRRYLREIHRGLSRDVEGVVKRFDEEKTFREGLNYYGMIINVGNPEDPEDDRLVYWDALLPRPDVAEGDRVHVRAHGNDIIGLKKQ